MTSQEDTDLTNSSLSPAVLVWESPSLSENLSTICFNAQTPTSVYLHWRRTSQRQLWELCRWHHLGDCIWRKTRLLMSLDLIGKQRWGLDVITCSITGDQRQPMNFFQEYGTWQRPVTADMSSSTTCQSWFLLKRTGTNGKL